MHGQQPATSVPVSKKQNDFTVENIEGRFQLIQSTRRWLNSSWRTAQAQGRNGDEVEFSQRRVELVRIVQASSCRFAVQAAIRRWSLVIVETLRNLQTNVPTLPAGHPPPVRVQHARRSEHGRGHEGTVLQTQASDRILDPEPQLYNESTATAANGEPEGDDKGAAESDKDDDGLSDADVDDNLTDDTQPKKVVDQNGNQSAGDPKKRDDAPENLNKAGESKVVSELCLSAEGRVQMVLVGFSIRSRQHKVSKGASRFVRRSVPCQLYIHRIDRQISTRPQKQPCSNRDSTRAMTGTRSGPVFTVHLPVLSDDDLFGACLLAPCLVTEISSDVVVPDVF
ncbi:conserved hypothetical protein [Culex quinquefasciatus]|uniref:Uncharacterized protein n=1 Tax=Culex quinquefasciatus TaxID=7176 RepID=B0WRF7_CULQU|nr:conserved hypothetical protein [Culex quinquefasciatus]|eukprot:XP_001851291.1 conserved hypothetical protein [Culex quinquefasciatus]